MNKLFKKLTTFSLCFAFPVFLGLGIKNQSIEPVKAETYSQSIEDYYSGINWNQTGATLKTALYNKIKISTAGWSYDGLWTAYKTTDVRPDGTHFWDIYSDSTMYTLNDSRINQSYSKEGDSINREHVIPQSSFNEASPMKSDIHHVLPSDGYVNNRRSNYPHGIVSGNPTYTSHDGCKLGTGTNNSTVFEPMDQYKGDIARIYFYFVTCYENKMSSNSFSAFDKTTYPSIKSAYLNVYLQWAKEDPVSQKEIDRNNAAYKGQGNRNPFVDCPYAVGAIWDSAHASDYGDKGAYTSGAGITINKTSVSLISGNTTKISATSTSSSSITWSTSNSSVVSLSSTSSSSGSEITLTAGNAGTATVTASTTISGTTYSKKCTVTVNSSKQVSSISVKDQRTSFVVGEDFTFGGVVTATYNDETTQNVTSSCSFSGYNMSNEGSQTVTVSYTYSGKTVTTTYEITVSTTPGQGDISDYTVSSSRLTSSGVKNGQKVVWGTSTTNLATSIDNNWVYLSTNSEDWLIFVIEGTSSGFKLKNNDNYVYCSGAKKVSFDSNSTTFTLNSSGYVTNTTSGTFYLNGTGLRPYTSGSYTGAYLYPLIENKTLSYISVYTSPNKTVYEIGEYFDPTGLVIKRTYTDNSYDTYTYAGHENEFSFEPSLYDPLTSYDTTVDICYEGISCFFDIDIINQEDASLESISVSGYRTSFVEGDEFEFDGICMAHYDDSSEFDVSDEVTITGYDMTVIGNQTVTVTYEEVSTTYQINVAKGTLSSISVSGQTTSYMKNNSFSFDGTCTATMENGYQKVVTPTSVSSPDMSTAGNQTVTVSFTYNGKTKTTSYQITVNSSRTVIEESYSLLGTITYTTDKEVISGDALSTTKSGGYSQLDTQYHAWRLGSSSKTGSLTVSSTSTNIYKIVINARYYSNDSGTTFTISGESYALSNTYADYTKEYSTPTNSVTISSVTNSKRILIASITVYTKSEVDISQSDDCLGLESFINDYMHMNYVDSLGYCKDSEHHYYSTAKDAFNNLNSHQRVLFTANNAYATEWARLQAWATFNGEALTNNNLLAKSNNLKVANYSFIQSEYIIVAIGMTSLLSLLALCCVKNKKRKY